MYCINRRHAVSDFNLTVFLNLLTQNLKIFLFPGVQLFNDMHILRNDPVFCFHVTLLCGPGFRYITLNDYCTGILTVNTLLSFSLIAVMLPPWASTISLAMASPSPAPPAAVPLALSSL